MVDVQQYFCEGLFTYGIVEPREKCALHTRVLLVTFKLGLLIPKIVFKDSKLNSCRAISCHNIKQLQGLSCLLLDHFNAQQEATKCMYLHTQLLQPLRILSLSNLVSYTNVMSHNFSLPIIVPSSHFFRLLGSWGER